MSPLILSHAGRCAVVLIGALGLLSTIQTACTFSAPPPEKTIAHPDAGNTKEPPTKTGEPVIEDASTSDDGVGMRPPVRVYGYGYGYGPFEGGGPYGYGYGYGGYGYGYGFYR